MPTLIAGRTPEKKRLDSRKIWPSVIEMTFVGMYAAMSPACVSMTGSAVSEPAAEVVRELARALEQPRVEIEDVAGERLAARRAAEQQRQLAVRVGVLREVVVDAERVLALVEEVLAHRAAGERRHPLDRRGLLRRRRDDDRVLHRAGVAQPLDDLRDRRALLPDRDVDAHEVAAALVQDRVDRDRGLAGRAVADDELALATTDRGHRVDRLEPRVHAAPSRAVAG